MRFTPLVSSLSDPALWQGFPALELVWQGGDPSHWLRQGPPIHAIHLPEPLTDVTQAGPALQALLTLGADFLVVPAALPTDRLASSRLLSALEVLLEAIGRRGPRLVLRPGADGQALASLLREVKGEAVGFCWDGAVTDIVALEDRLLCAVATAEDNLEPLQVRGFRWNVAVPISDPERARDLMSALSERHPAPLFPTLIPALPPLPEAP